MDLQKGKGRPGLPGLKLGAAPAQGQVLSSFVVVDDDLIEKLMKNLYLNEKFLLVC